MRLLALGITVASLLSITGIAFANTWYIAPDGGGDALTIQAGVDSAAAGDTVMVVDGTFSGPGNRDVDFEGKAIVIKSQSGANATTIECDGSAVENHNGFIFLNGEGPGSVLQGFTIRGAYGDPNGGAVFCDGLASPTIKNCVFSYNVAVSHGAGIYAGWACSPTITNCLFYENSAWGGAGFSCYQECDSYISNCTFIKNYADFGAGVLSRSVEPIRPELRKCIIAFNYSGDSFSGCADLYCCDFYGNGGEDWDIYCIAWQATQRNNLSADPLFCGPDAQDYHIDVGSPCNDPFCGTIGAYGLGCDGYRTEVEDLPAVPASWGVVKSLFELPESR